MEFEEKQQLKLWWLYLLLGFETIVVGSVIFLHKGGMTLNELKETHFAPIWAMALPYFLVYILTKNLFTLKVDQFGITYRYWPFIKERTISWSHVTKAYLRKYDALGEYGGWGAKHRLWFKFNDKAYIFNDNNVGLQLELDNQKKLLFSTAKVHELNLFLINLKRSHSIGVIENDVRER